MPSATLHRLPVKYRAHVEPTLPEPNFARGMVWAFAISVPLYIVAAYGVGLWAGWWR